MLSTGCFFISLFITLLHHRHPGLHTHIRYLRLPYFVLILTFVWYYGLFTIRRWTMYRVKSDIVEYTVVLVLIYIGIRSLLQSGDTPWMIERRYSVRLAPSSVPLTQALNN